VHHFLNIATTVLSERVVMYWSSKALVLRGLTVAILVASAAFVSLFLLRMIFNLINGMSCGMFSDYAEITAMAPSTQSTKIFSTSTATYEKFLAEFLTTLWKALRSSLALRPIRWSYSSK